MNSTSMQKVNYTCREFRPDDVLLMPLRDEEREAWHGFDLLAVGEAKQGHPNRTLLADDIPLACYGLLMPWPTLGIVWAFVAANAYQHRRMLWTVLKAEWASMMDAYKDLRRIEALTLKGDAAARRVVERLGMWAIAEKRWYGPQGATYIEYEWSRGD